MWKALALAAVGATLYSVGALVLLGEVGDSRPTHMHRFGVGCAASGTALIFAAVFFYPV